MSKQTNTLEIPEELKSISEKSGVSISEISSLVFHFNQDQIRFKDQFVKLQQSEIRELEARVQWKKLMIADHDTEIRFKEIFSPPKPAIQQPKKKFWKK